VTFVENAQLSNLDKSQQSAATHATDFQPPIYNVWKQQTKTNGSNHFGNSEVRWLDNLLYLYTQPFDMVVDPFAGGGGCPAWPTNFVGCEDSHPRASACDIGESVLGAQSWAPKLQVARAWERCVPGVGLPTPKASVAPRVGAGTAKREPGRRWGTAAEAVMVFNGAADRE
jgi:hypothetical protein